MANSNTTESMANSNTTEPEEALLVAENISYCSSGTEKKITSIKDDDTLFEYEGEPVLVPGLAPLPRTTGCK